MNPELECKKAGCRETEPASGEHAPWRSCDYCRTSSDRSQRKLHHNPATGKKWPEVAR